MHNPTTHLSFDPFPPHVARMPTNECFSRDWRLLKCRTLIVWLKSCSIYLLELLHSFFTSSEVFQLIMWITTKSSGARWWWKMMMLYHKYLKNFSINIHEILIYQTSSLDSLCGDDWVSQLWTRWGISTFHVSTDSVVQPQHVLTTKLATWYAKSTSFFVSKIKNREI